MPDNDVLPPFVFVPGAWLGGWSWYPVARLLRERGHDVVPLTLPGLSYGSSPAGLRLADAVNFVTGEVERRDLTDIILVSHSWGGYPATGAAYRLAGRVRTVVYYNAVVPQDGVSMAGENEQYGQAIHASMAATPDQTVPLPFEAVQTGLMPDESAELQQLVFSLMLPQPGGYMVDSIDELPVTKTGLNAAYILGSGDISLARPGTEFADRLGVTPLVIPGSHMTLLSQPATVARALTSLL